MSFTYNDVSVLSPLKASGAKVRISLLLKSLQKKKIKINYDLTLCLKITEKVAFNIAREASYVYIFSGQKFIKNAKNGQFWRFLK